MTSFSNSRSEWKPARRPERSAAPDMHISPPTMSLTGDPLKNLAVNSLRLLADEVGRVLELGVDGDAERDALQGARETVQKLADHPPETERAERIAARLAALLAEQPRPAQDVAGLWRDVARLRQDLVYLGHIERGGIDALNALLADLLGQLQAAKSDRGGTNKAAGGLNDLLRRAIYLFPHLTTCVTVEIGLADHEFDAGVAQFIGRQETNRAELERLWRDHGAPRAGEHRVLHLPLPYLFAASSDAERRLARRQSWEDLAFVPRRWVQRQDIRGGAVVGRGRMKAELPPILLVRTAVNPELGISRSAWLLAREVRRIAFSAESDYLRVFYATTAHTQPQARPDTLMHYLVFRDFGDIGRNPRLARSLDIPRIEDHSLLEPEYATGLLDVGDDELARQWLERGFGYLALPGLGQEPTKLLRFEGVEVAYDRRSVRTAKNSPLQRALYRAALDRQDPLRERATVFTGAGILRELLQVPVAPRRFGSR